MYLSEPLTPLFLNADLSANRLYHFCKLVYFCMWTFPIDSCFLIFSFLFVINLGPLTLKLMELPRDLYSNNMHAWYIWCLQCLQNLYNVIRMIRCLEISKDSLMPKLFFTQLWLHPSYEQGSLTHWGRDKMATISQTTLSSAFLWMKILEFRLRCHWSVLLRVQSTIFWHCFR